ncbi:MAG TPA: phosphatidate cytidylyltransferase [Anaerolineales bacterium]
MHKRALTALGLALIGLPAVIIGGPIFFVVISVFLVGAALEYVEMFRSVGICANEILTVGGVFLLLGLRAFLPEFALPALAAAVLAAMAVHLIDFERGRDKAALDFGVTVGGLAYLGWLGAYLIDLRYLPNGGWYFMLVMPVVWMADVGAYALGAAYGRHKMTPRLSPKKSWEGYWAGVFTGVITGAFFVFAFKTFGSFPTSMTPWLGGLLGLLLAAVTPLGDLGESMFKRQAHMKDSSEVFPGHGGFFDRIDTWVWAGTIGFFFIQWFVL